MDEKPCIAICADINIEVGLHVTLVSLAEHASEPFRLYLLHKGYSDGDLQKIAETLKPFAHRVELQLIAFDDSLFQNYRGLHGNKFAFTRIVLADQLPVDKVLYLDSDLYVEADACALFRKPLGDYVIAANPVASMDRSLEKAFYESLNVDMKSMYFNSGVLLLDLAKWRAQGLTKKCFDFADQYPNELVTADQTVLNYLFQPNQYLFLENHWNTKLYPSTPTISAEQAAGGEKCIYHFVGSPKPWDLFGEFLHKNYGIFSKGLKSTACRRFKSYWPLKWSTLIRASKLARSYYKLLLK